MSHDIKYAKMSTTPKTLTTLVIVALMGSQLDCLAKLLLLIPIRVDYSSNIYVGTPEQESTKYQEKHDKNTITVRPS